MKEKPIKYSAYIGIGIVLSALLLAAVIVIWQLGIAIMHQSAPDNPIPQSEMIIEKDSNNHIKSISWYHNGILDSTKHIKSY